MLFSLIAETEPCYVAQVGLKFTGIYLLLPPQCQGSFYFFVVRWGYMYSGWFLIHLWPRMTLNFSSSGLGFEDKSHYSAFMQCQGSNP